MMDASQKVRAQHFGRKAYLYVRQSTVRQVIENSESGERQYALRRRAVALGWPDEQIVVWGSRARCRKPSCTSCAPGCAAAS